MAIIKASDTTNGYILRLESGDTSSTSTRFISFYDANGNSGTGPGEIGYIRPNGGTGVTLTSVSDRRLKRNIKPIKSRTKDLLNIEVSTWNWKKSGQHATGVIAQDFINHFPELVSLQDTSDPDSRMFVDYQGLIPHLVQAIQDQQSEIESLNVRLKKLEELLNA